MELDADLVINYAIHGELGRGGMGVVYRATHRALDRTVALKVLSSQASDQSDVSRRFLAEAKMANRIAHPAVAAVLDAGVLPSGELYIAYEFVDGRTLSSVMERAGRLEPSRAAALLAKVFEGLEAIHAAGVVHRDFKPQNLIVTADEQVKIIDFGIARDLIDESVKTRTGIILGTPAYMTPESISGGKIGPASDVYSLGVVLFEMLVGRPPFEAAVIHAVLGKHVGEPPPSLVALIPEVPAALNDLVAAMLAKDPATRPGVAEVRRVLEKVARSDRAVPVPAGGAARAPGSGRYRRSAPAGAPAARSAMNTVVARQPAGGKAGRTRMLMIAASVALAVLFPGAIYLALRGRPSPQPRDGGSSASSGSPGDLHPDPVRAEICRKLSLLAWSPTRQRHRNTEDDRRNRAGHLRSVLEALGPAHEANPGLHGAAGLLLKSMLDLEMSVRAKPPTGSGTAKVPAEPGRAPAAPGGGAISGARAVTVPEILVEQARVVSQLCGATSHSLATLERILCGVEQLRHAGGLIEGPAEGLDVLRTVHASFRAASHDRPHCGPPLLPPASLPSPPPQIVFSIPQETHARMNPLQSRCRKPDGDLILLLAMVLDDVGLRIAPKVTLDPSGSERPGSRVGDFIPGDVNMALVQDFTPNKFDERHHAQLRLAMLWCDLSYLLPPEQRPTDTKTVEDERIETMRAGWPASLAPGDWLATTAWVRSDCGPESLLLFERLVERFRKDLDPLIKPSR